MRAYLAGLFLMSSFAVLGEAISIAKSGGLPTSHGR